VGHRNLKARKGGTTTNFFKIQENAPTCTYSKLSEQLLSSDKKFGQMQMADHRHGLIKRDHKYAYSKCSENYQKPFHSSGQLLRSDKNMFKKILNLGQMQKGG
jgi:hypothetical protein